LIFYKRHIGDYAAATRHLSLLEHGVYNLLLDIYYLSEKPLPVDTRAVQRLVNARSKDEREAVDTLLEEFFEKRDDGWHQSRCDEEIFIHAVAMERLDFLHSKLTYRRFRNEVLERDGAFCAYCGATDVPLELDHIHPRSRGGADSPDNLTPACKRCNTSKGAKTLDEWGFR
jgi:uncharacterized protein YdaU (DUF1376 family)